MSLGISRKELRETQAEVKKIRAKPHPYELMKIREAAEMADLNPQSIRRWIREGRIKAYGWKGSLRVRVTDLLPEVEIT
jgi:transposase